jgi:hypothetical protein
MAGNNTLIIIKTVHTIIWLMFNAVLFYMAYAVIVNNINIYVWLGIASIIVEGLVLLAFGWQCPLTIVARKYSASQKDNFDIYLPNWLAKHNKVIYTTFFVFIICGLIFRLLKSHL